MAIENFTTFTKVDPGGYITVDSSSQLTVANMPRSARSFLYKDMGVDFFTGNFNFSFKITYGAINTNFASPCTIANLFDSMNGVSGAGGDQIYIGTRFNPTQTFFSLVQMVGGVNDSLTNTPIFPLSATYYCNIVRDLQQSTFGTLYLFVYDDVARTQPNAIAYKDLTANINYRYIYAVQSEEGASAAVDNFVIEDLELSEGNHVIGSGGSGGTGPDESDKSRLILPNGIIPAFR